MYLPRAPQTRQASDHRYAEKKLTCNTLPCLKRIPMTVATASRFATFPAITQGDDDAEAMAMAGEVLISSIEFYLDNIRPIPQSFQSPAGRATDSPAGQHFG